MNKPILYLLILISFTGFAQSKTAYPQAVKAALIKAGKNRPELEKTITYFKKTGDPLKLKAAYFLIANMDIHYSMNYYWADAKGKRILFNELDYSDLNKAQVAFKKLKDINPGLHPVPFRSEDITTIKSDFLIDNINNSFQQWREASAYKNIPFNDFCEYVLPYRVSVEPLLPWRKKYNETFKWVHTKYQSEGLEKTLKYVSTDFRSWFTNTFSWGKSKEPLPRQAALQILFRKQGPCEDIADLVTFTMRSQGIPAAINFIPYWATSTASHFTNTVYAPQMQPIAFDAIGNPPVNNTLAREPSKVIRLTYSKQRNTLANEEKAENIPLGFMRTFNYLDVTDKFWATGDVKCDLFPESAQPGHAYICVFNGLRWQPTWWAAINNNKATFKNMAKGVVFLPAYYINGKIRPAGYPIAQGYNHQLILTPDLLHKQSVFIKQQEKYLIYQPGKVYRLYYWDNDWRLIGKQTAPANADKLLFTNVPGKALYLLIPEYSEGKERPFMILDNGEIKWW